VADVPETVALSEICSAETFFKIVSFNLSAIVDLTALERYKAEFRQSVVAEMVALDSQAAGAERMVSRLGPQIKACQVEKEASRLEGHDHQTKVRVWRRAALNFLWLLTVLTIFVTFFFVPFMRLLGLWQ